MRAVVLVAFTAAGCGDNWMTGADVDADMGVDASTSIAVADDCWDMFARFPKGAATLGTGREAFQTMPEMLPLEYGTQDGFMLIANVRMTGFAPGNPDDTLDPNNLRTRVRAFFDDTNVPLAYKARCSFRAGYVPASNGEYEVVEPLAVVFDTCWRSDNLFGRKLRVELEIMDQHGGYARDVRVVTALAPTDFYVEDTNSPGCVYPPDVAPHLAAGLSLYPPQTARPPQKP